MAVIELSEKKAQRSADCRDWTARDAVAACLRDIDNGTINPDKLVVCYREKIGNDEVEYSYYAAGTTNIELCGLLTIQLRRVSE